MATILRLMILMHWHLSLGVVHQSEGPQFDLFGFGSMSPWLHQQLALLVRLSRSWSRWSQFERYQLTGDLNNIDYFVTMQCSAGQWRAQTF